MVAVWMELLNNSKSNAHLNILELYWEDDVIFGDVKFLFWFCSYYSNISEKSYSVENVCREIEHFHDILNQKIEYLSWVRCQNQ